MPYVFNPFTGTLDWTNPVVPPSVVPTEVLTGVTYTLPTHTQTLFRRTIILDAGAVISAAADAILIGV